MDRGQAGTVRHLAAVFAGPIGHIAVALPASAVHHPSLFSWSVRSSWAESIDVTARYLSSKTLGQIWRSDEMSWSRLVNHW